MFAAKKTRNGSRGINLCVKCASIPVFAMCQVRLQNGMEPPKTWVLDWNSGLACSLWQNKKWFWRHKLEHLMHPILIFTMGQVWQQNGVKPPETRVLDVKYVVRNQTDALENWNGVQNTQNVTFGPKEVHWNLSNSMSRVLQFWNIQSNARRY